MEKIENLEKKYKSRERNGQKRDITTSLILELTREGKRLSDNINKLGNKIYRLHKYSSFLKKTRIHLLKDKLSKYRHNLSVIENKLSIYYPYRNIKVTIKDISGEVLIDKDYPEFITIGWLIEEIHKNKGINPSHQLIFNNDSRLKSKYAIGNITTTSNLELYLVINTKIDYTIYVKDQQTEENIKYIISRYYIDDRYVVSGYLEKHLHDILFDKLEKTKKINILDTFLKKKYNWWNTRLFSNHTYIIRNNITQEINVINTQNRNTTPNMNNTLITNENVVDSMRYFINTIPTNDKDRRDSSTLENFNECMEPFIRLSNKEDINIDDYDGDLRENIEFYIEDAYSNHSESCPSSCFDDDNDYQITTCDNKECLSDVINYCNNYIHDHYMSFDEYHNVIDFVIIDNNLSTQRHINTNIILSISGEIYNNIENNKWWSHKHNEEFYLKSYKPLKGKY